MGRDAYGLSLSSRKNNFEMIQDNSAQLGEIQLRQIHANANKYRAN